MLSFRDYITTLSEAFLGGFKSINGYTELYKNPTRDEFALTGRRASEYDIPYDLEQYGKSCQIMAAILAGPDLYVWDRDTSSHAAARNELSDVTGSKLPLMLNVFPAKKVIAISIAGWTMSAAEQMNLPATLQGAANHPRFKGWTTVDAFSGEVLRK